MRKRGSGVLVALVLALSLVVAVPATQSQTGGPYIPPNTPPIIKLKLKAKVKAGKKVKIGFVTCGTGSCTLTGTGKVKAGGRGVKSKIKSGGTIPAGQTHTIFGKLKKKARGALFSAGKGKLKVNLTAVSTNGLSATAAGKVKLKPKVKK
jgi:hypothetical protein